MDYMLWYWIESWYRWREPLYRLLIPRSLAMITTFFHHSPAYSSNVALICVSSVRRSLRQLCDSCKLQQHPRVADGPQSVRDCFHRSRKLRRTMLRLWAGGTNWNAEMLSDASSRIDGKAQCKGCLNSDWYRVFTCIHCQSHRFTCSWKIGIPAFVQANRTTGDSWRSKSKLNTTGSWSQDLRGQVSPPQVPSESSKSKENLSHKATAKLEETQMELQAELGKKAKVIEA